MEIGIFGIAGLLFAVFAVAAAIWVRRETRRNREADRAAASAFNQPTDEPGQLDRPIWRPNEK